MTDNYSSRTWLLGAVLLLCIAVVGCTPEEEMGTVSGTVYANGVPCGNCQIEIVGVSSNLSIGAYADGDGKFKVERVPMGDYGVAIHQRIDPHAAGNIPADKRIPQKFQDVKTSGLTVSVPTKEEVTFNPDMK